MKNIFNPLVVVLAILLIFTSVGIPVGAQGSIEDETTYQGEDQTLQGSGINAAVPGGPGFIMVHPSAFMPMDSTMQYSLTGGGALYNPGTNNSEFGVAVNLPHGAQITKVVLYYFDNSPTDNILFYFYATNLDTSEIFGLTTFGSTGADANNRVRTSTTITPDTIDNQSNAYWIYVTVPGSQYANLKIRGVRIDYSYQVNVPLVNK
ncbi:MAG: hypothetical protein GX768_11040 [Chloroflexi bacterium]|jgi:hypothetical protein|nr:hypothetical protein [Chloroflexota bacterium]